MFLKRTFVTAGFLTLFLLSGCASSAEPTPTPGVSGTVPQRTAESQTPVSPSTVVAEEATAAVAPSSPTAPDSAATSAPTSAATSGPAAAPSATAAVTSAATAGATSAATGEPASRVKAPPSPDELAGIRLNVRRITENLDQPLFFTAAGRDAEAQYFILEKPGRIRLWANDVVVEQPFLDITGRVGSSGSEQGLLGLAFPPDYAETGFFFINYTNREGDTVIARFSVTGDPNVADPNSESVVLTIEQPAANHNGGMLVFGPDGMLWIGTGDGGAANDRFNNGQNPGTLLGKMLRLDVTSDTNVPYRIPQDNPWVQANWNGQDARDEIWAFGMRNPWRYSFDRVTGDLWVADVGQNQIEEMNFIQGGGPGGEAAAPAGGLNFGWPIMEGNNCFREANCSREGLVLPVAQYQHAGGNGCSVTGGYVYRGDAYPQLQGAYLYADFCSGRLWGLVPDGSGGWHNRLMLETGMSISSFGEDAAGELFLTDLQRGTLTRIEVEQ